MTERPPQVDRLAADLVYLVDADGVRWRVHDVGFWPPHAPPFKHRVYDLGSDRATERRFVRQDGTQRVYPFGRGDSHEIAADVLVRPLGGAGYVARERYEPIKEAVVI